MIKGESLGFYLVLCELQYVNNCVILPKHSSDRLRSTGPSIELCRPILDEILVHPSLRAAASINNKRLIKFLSINNNYLQKKYDLPYLKFYSFPPHLPPVSPFRRRPFCILLWCSCSTTCSRCNGVSGSCDDQSRPSSRRRGCCFRNTWSPAFQSPRQYPRRPRARSSRSTTNARAHLRKAGICSCKRRPCISGSRHSALWNLPRQVSPSSVFAPVISKLTSVKKKKNSLKQM